MSELFKVILIETVNVCTRTCWFCKFGQDRQDEAKIKMGWDTIEKIIKNLSDLNYQGRVSWFWINEPLLEKRMIDIVKLTKKHCPNAFQSLNTNGDLLDASLYRDLRKAGLDAIGVSIYDDETYEKIQAMQKDDKLIMIDSRRPQDLGLENRAGNIKQEYEFFESKHKEFKNVSCARPFEMMIINSNGEVSLCCSDLYSDVIMGDAKKERLEEIWYNKKFTHYRNTLDESGREGLSLCDVCSYSGQSTNVYYPLHENPKVSSITKAVNRVRKLAKKILVSKA